MTESKTRPATPPADDAPPSDRASAPEPADETYVPAPVEPEHAGERMRVRDGEQADVKGIPAGHLVVGALSTFVLGGWALWEWLGAMGLLIAGGTTVAAGGAYGYVRWRIAHPDRARRLSSALGFGQNRHTGPGGHGGGYGLFGGSHGRGRGLFGGSSGHGPGSRQGGHGGGVGRRMSFGGSHGAAHRGASSRIPSLFGGSPRGSASPSRPVPLTRRQGPTGPLSPRQVLDRLARGPGGGNGRGNRRGMFRPPIGGPGGGGSRRRGPGPGGYGGGRNAADHASRGVRAAIGRGARKARSHGRAIDSEWTAATRRIASQAGRGFTRAGRRMQNVNREWTAGARKLASMTGRRAGKIGRWFDRRTGRVTSLGWKALVDGNHGAWNALRGAYTRWDAQMLFGALTFTEWATRGLRRWLGGRGHTHHADATDGEASNPASPLNPTRLIISGAKPIYRRNALSALIMPGAGPSPLVAMSAEMVAGVARFLPPDMWWVAADLEQLDQVTSNVAAALRAYARNLDVGYPIDQRIVEMFDEYATTVGKSSDYPIAIAQAFKQIHDVDIKRRLLPRTNEHLWNV